MIMPSHFSLLLVFALSLSVVLAGLLRANARERVKYALRSFALFVGIGVAIAWFMYPFSH